MATTPTRAQIAAADDELDAIGAAILLSLIRQSGIYAVNPNGYANLEGVITSVGTGIKAQQINAALTLIDGIGPGEVEIKGDEDATHYSIRTERDALIAYCISILYDAPLNSIYGVARRTSSVVPTPARW